MCDITIFICSDTEEGAPDLGGAEGMAEENEDTPAAAVVGGDREGEEEARDEVEEDSPFRDSDEEQASPPMKKQKLNEGT